MRRHHRSPVPLTAAWVAVGWVCVVPHLAGQTTASPAPTTDQHVEATIEGLENIKLLEKGITAGDTAEGRSGSALLSGASLEQKSSPPLVAPSAPRDEVALQELQREQWARENWLVEGLRREALAGDEAALTADALLDDPAAPTDDSAGGTSAYWLALAANPPADTDRSAADARDGDSAADASASGANPLGEFMADWLSDRSRSLFTTVESSGANQGGSWGQLTTRGAAETEATGGGGFTAGRAGGTATTENPFLVALDDDLASVRLPAHDQPTFDSTGQMSPLSSPIYPIAPVQQAAPAVLPAATPAETPHRESAEPYRPPAKEDEKYFPRLKRF